MTLGIRPQTTSKRLLHLGVCMLALTGWTSPADAQDLGDVIVGEIGKREESILAVNHFISQGDTYTEEGDLKLAFGAYRTAFMRLPLGDAAEGFRNIASQRYANSATAYAEKLMLDGHPQEAQQILEEVLSEGFVPDHKAAQEMLERAGDPEWAAPGNTTKHRKEVSEVGKLLTEAKTLNQMGEFDEATNKYSQVLNIDPTNKAARMGLSESIQYQKPYWDAAYDETRATMLDDIASKWRYDNPDTVAGYGRSEEAAITASDSLQEGQAQSGDIAAKLQQTIIPEVNFNGLNIDAAVDYLTLVSQEFDPTDGDPATRGVKFNVSASDEIDRARPMQIQMRSVPLIEVLRYVTRFAGAKFRVDQYAVHIIPASEEDTSLISRPFTVRPDFFTSGPLADSGEVDDPFAVAGDTTSVQRVSAQDFLTQNGITFPEGSSAQYLPQSNRLLVRNTFSNLQLVSDLVDASAAAGPKQVVLEVRMLDVRQENLEEIGFDWLIGPFELNQSKDILAGGGQLVPINDAENFGFSDPETGQVFGGQRVTGGLRSGPEALGLDALNSIIGTDRFNSGIATTTTAPGVISIAGAMTDPQFQAVMRGLSQKKAVDIVTAPKVVVKSGQRAKIESGQELIYPVEYDPPELPQEVVTTGGVFPVTPSHPTTFEMRPLGFTLEVDPVISGDNQSVDVTLAPSFVEFLGFVNYGSPITAAGTDALGAPTQIVVTENQILMPVFSTVRESLSATVYDGATLVIGGLRESSIDQINDKVPIIGDVPFIGRLFRSHSERRKNRAIVIFLTARVIDAKGASLNREFGQTVAEAP